MKLLLIGHGRMGRLTEDAARTRGHEIAGILTSKDTTWQSADAAIDYSIPTAVLTNAERAAKLGIPLVIGATGWYEQIEALRALVNERIPCLYAHNFSVGLHRFLQGAATLARTFANDQDFDVVLQETHHRHKLDRPSGTALKTAQVLTEAGRSPSEVISLRCGEVPGTHEVIIDGPFETITLTHRARSRLMWADGAVKAAEWLAKQPTGLYTFEQFLDSEVLCDSMV